ncbi:hypothetical protein [Polynucleobacter ibericus]|uniref:hypothetical protein n=1 Tax=Polynucleobacter ibericus TaxID=1819725 RepID=UPI001BFE2D74|nr:hypothetical protein [Polynucleobacter ibericus]QWE09529.1 hypothetical protein AOC20_04890 [Polynucleobacter ibericus]
MNINLIKPYSLVISVAFVVAGCSVAQLEARLEANPQCKDVVNPKTGALMPCPGSDKSFYREVGLAPAKAAPTPSIAKAPGATPSAQTSSNGSAQVAGSPTKASPMQVDCKPQNHKKTGAIMPCPSPD